MAKTKPVEIKRTIRTPEEELPFWEMHLRKIMDMYTENPNEANATWKNNVLLRVEDLKKQIANASQKNNKPKF